MTRMPKDRKRLDARAGVTGGKQEPTGTAATPAGTGPPFTAHDLEIYKVYREYVQHEDNLINHRSSWNATVQAFLFAAFAVAVQSRVDARTEFTRQLTFFAGAWLIPLVGLFVALATLFSVIAASRAIRALERKYTEIYAPWHVNRPAHLPSLTGGGSSWAHLTGFALPFVIPVLLALAWSLTWWFTAREVAERWQQDDRPRQTPVAPFTPPAKPEPAPAPPDVEEGR